MTAITGTVQDIGMAPLSGSLVATAVEFRTSGDVVVAPESRSWPIVAGVVSVDLLPGPTRLTVQVGSHARESFDVIVPDDPTTLARLVEDAFPWTPQVVSRVAALRDEAVAARDVAVSAAESAAEDAQVVGSAAQDMSAQVSAAQGHAQAAAGSASSAASSAGAAAQFATDAEGSASDAAGAVVDARAARDAAEGHASSAAGSASAAAGSAVEAGGHADRAEAAANEFGLTASSSTIAPGSQATVTVTGDGPAYQVAFGIPQGAKGDKGDEGEISQAQLDAAVASLVDGAPEALNTLSELAQALGDDPNFATTTATAIGERAKTSDVNAALSGKADLVDGKVPESQLPEIGGAVDPATEAEFGTVKLAGNLTGTADEPVVRTTFTTDMGNGPEPLTLSLNEFSEGMQQALAELFDATGNLSASKADLDSNGKLPADQLPEHSHTTAQVTGLDAALAGKASSTHTHTPASLGAVARSGTAVTLWSGTAAQYAALAEATKNAAGFIAVITD